MINAKIYTGYGLGAPFDNTEKYEQRHDWRIGARGHTKLTSVTSSTSGTIWEEIRQVMGGATSGVTGINFVSGFMRNLSSSLGLDGLVHNTADIYSFPLGDSDGTQLSSTCAYPGIITWESISGNQSSLLSVAEGIDEVAENEFACLSGLGIGSEDVMKVPTRIVGGAGLTLADINLAASRNVEMVWTPRSDTSLYGNTAIIPAFKRAGGKISLGTYWVHSGSPNMLRELSCADQWNSAWNSNIFTDNELVNMATINAATSTGFDDVMGSIEIGKVADLVIWNASVNKGYRAIIDAANEDVVLVLKGGVPLYGDQTLVETLVPSDGCDTLDVCGTSKSICTLREFGMTMAQINTTPGAYPLFSCDNWTTEPTCTPSRPNEYTGLPTGTDLDGDGVEDVSDNCPGMFNPPMPLSGGVQADTNGNGIGDICDSGDTSLPAPVLLSITPSLAFITEGQVNATTTPSLEVNLTLPAKTDTQVSLSSGNPSSLTVPTFVTVLTGSASVNVPVTGVAQNLSVDVTATLNSISRSTSVRVLGASELPQAISMTPVNATISFSNSLEMTVSLDIPSPAGGAVVNLSLDQPTAGTLPPSVIVPEGEMQSTFNFTSGSTATTVTIYAAWGAEPLASSTINIVDASHNLVINEIDYDQPGTDSNEFIEILNTGPDNVDLANLELVLINGATEVDYMRIPLDTAGNTLSPGQYLVVGSPTVVPDQSALFIEFPLTSNNIQNGGPDAVGIIDNSALELLDALSYEGSVMNGNVTGIGTFNFVEGTAATAADSGDVEGSLVRSPNGSDIDDADTDWAFTSTPTPGSANIY